MKIILFIFMTISIIKANYLANDIQLEGLTQISKKIALEKINIEKGTRYTNDHVNNIIKTFYSYGYFDDISISTTKDTLTIKFVEKPFIVNLEMTGYKTNADDLKEVFASMNIKRGSMYTAKKIENSKKLLLKELENEGYINSVVDVDIQNINGNGKSLIFNVNKGEEIIITKVNYIGQEKLDIDDFEDATANKEVEVASWWFGQNDGVLQYSQIEYDGLRIKNTYLEHGYLDAKVSHAFSQIDYNSNSAEVDFNIKEGNQYKIKQIILYNDDKIVKTKVLQDGLKLSKNKTFNIAKLRRDVRYIKNMVANEGYAFAKVSYDIRKDKKTSTATVIYNVQYGEKVYINDVIISGNTRTLDRIIRRSVYLAPQDLYNGTDLSDSRKALKRTGFFAEVTITKKRISKNLIDLNIKVTETATGNLTFGGGYGSYDGWTLNGSVSDKNIFGSGLNLGFSLSRSNKSNTAALSLKNPSIRDSIYNGSLSVYKKESTIDDAITGDEATATTGISVGVGRAIGRHVRVGTTYAYENKIVTNDLNATYEDKYTESSLTPYITFNNTDDYYLPRSGMSASLFYKYVGIGGEGKYSQTSLGFKYFYGLRDRFDTDVILRFKSNLKIMKDNGFIPSGTSYYLGGVTSVRGYQSYAFQPINDDTPYKNYLVNTAEASFALMPKAKIRIALFYDNGNIGYDSFSDVKKSGYGASLNWQSPVGPIQFIFPKAINPDPTDSTSNFEFSLGTKF